MTGYFRQPTTDAVVKRTSDEDEHGCGRYHRCVDDASPGTVEADARHVDGDGRCRRPHDRVRVFSVPSALTSIGPVSRLGWVLTGAGSVLLAFVFANLARGYPRTAGPYAYARHGFGDVMRF